MIIDHVLTYHFPFFVDVDWELDVTHGAHDHFHLSNEILLQNFSFFTTFILINFLKSSFSGKNEEKTRNFSNNFSFFTAENTLYARETSIFPRGISSGRNEQLGAVGGVGVLQFWQTSFFLKKLKHFSSKNMEWFFDNIFYGKMYLSKFVSKKNCLGFERLLRVSSTCFAAIFLFLTSSSVAVVFASDDRPDVDGIWTLAFRFGDIFLKISIFFEKNAKIEIQVASKKQSSEFFSLHSKFRPLFCVSFKIRFSVISFLSRHLSNNYQDNYP